MRKKVKKIQITRALVQLISFFLLPGIYIMAFSELKTIYGMIIKGSFNFVQAIPNLMSFLSVILTTILFGRFFCGWFCTFGAYNDLIHEISKNIFKVKYRVDEKIDSKLKYLKYVILLLIILLPWAMKSTIFDNSSPWDAFAQITNFPQVISDFTVGFILLLVITIGAFFIERFFCRYLCPLGAVFTIFSKLSAFKINKPKANCGSCRACTNNCSMGIKLYKTNKVTNGECINCLKCVEVCPRKNAQSNLLGKNINVIAAVLIATIFFIGLYTTNSYADRNLSRKEVKYETNISTDVTKDIVNESNASNSSKKYKDGTYTGSASGFRGGTTEVSVTVKDGKIANIETISNEDTPRFYERVENIIPDKIISNQSTNVDTISGATYSSRGIINAVKDALSKAM